jgi:hypothetical protein
MNVNPILFKPIKKIQLLIFDYEPDDYPLIEQVVFTTDDGISLVLKSEPNFDEIIVEIVSDYQIVLTEKQTIISVDTKSDKSLSRCLNMSIIWIWFMTNNQNYDDGVEIELQDSNDSITFRFMVEASGINIGLLENVTKYSL